jgi:hypothetical protein
LQVAVCTFAHPVHLFEIETAAKLQCHKLWLHACMLMMLIFVLRAHTLLSACVNDNHLEPGCCDRCSRVDHKLKTGKHTYSMHALQGLCLLITFVGKGMPWCSRRYVDGQAAHLVLPQ